ncbi:MAG: tripartite tricarboxylate transporter TctB family protein [Gammaproteobacteria bacterium]|nr:tripartite tricarboxylate transporter TctB family protein [Gammaproteobacteria bacterium]
MSERRETSRADANERSPFRLSRLPVINLTDLWLCLIILAACIGLYVATMNFEKVSDMFAQDVPPEFFPRLLLWTIGILALLLPFEHIHLRRRNEDIDEHRTVSIKPISFVTVVLLALVVASMKFLGTWLAMTLVCLALPLLWGERRLIVLVPYAVVFPGLVALLFAGVLKVHLEPFQLW